MCHIEIAVFLAKRNQLAPTVNHHIGLHYGEQHGLFSAADLVSSDIGAGVSSFDLRVRLVVVENRLIYMTDIVVSDVPSLKLPLMMLQL
ncbi:MAG: hypothetical protein MO846_04680 [Candidatus Devosia symbiotica]|nr:hypothetical protein [Candidatus Devosia symbiotica]